MNLRSRHRWEVRGHAGLAGLCPPSSHSVYTEAGVSDNEGQAIPEDGPVGLLSLLPVDQAGEKAKGLST